MWFLVSTELGCDTTAFAAHIPACAVPSAWDTTPSLLGKFPPLFFNWGEIHMT